MVDHLFLKSLGAGSVFPAFGWKGLTVRARSNAFPAVFCYFTPTVEARHFGGAPLCGSHRAWFHQGVKLAFRHWKKAMLDYLDEHKLKTKPFAWTADVDLTIGKVERLSQRTRNSGTKRGFVYFWELPLLKLRQARYLVSIKAGESAVNSQAASRRSSDAHGL